jgi:hypothetical protein
VVSKGELLKNGAQRNEQKSLSTLTIYTWKAKLRKGQLKNGNQEIEPQ